MGFIFLAPVNIFSQAKNTIIIMLLCQFANVFWMKNSPVSDVSNVNMLIIP